jgi:hypothetical protein
MFSKSVTFIKKVPVSYFVYKETGDSSVIISSHQCLAQYNDLVIASALCRASNANFHCNSQTHASTCVGKFMWRLVSL